MFALRDYATEKFEEFVILAEGNYQIVYEAYDEVEDPTEENIKAFISKRLKQISQ